MTIEERAKDFAGYNTPSPQDIATSSKMNGKYDGFKAGAEWMLEKAADWIGNYLMEIGYPDDWLRDSLNIKSGKERFRKAMEE